MDNGDVNVPIDEIRPRTDTAKRVVDLVRKYGRGYANGELDFARRGMALTGSEIPTICGENRFERPNAVLFRKAFDVRSPDSEATMHGRKYEPIAISKFRAQTGAMVFYVGFMKHEEYDFIGGTFDALAIMPSGEGVLVEVKCPFSRGISPVVPEHYVGQVQSYLEIAGLETCMFVQYKPAYTTPERKMHRPEKLIVTPVARDRSYFGTRMPVLWEFWKRLRAFREGVLPTADAAARAIQMTWKHGPKSAKAVLSCVRYRWKRRAYDGVSEATLGELEKTRPRMPRVPLPPGTVLSVVWEKDDDNEKEKKKKAPRGNNKRSAPDAILSVVVDNDSPPLPSTKIQRIDN